jgi:hypothetical protein
VKVTLVEATSISASRSRPSDVRDLSTVLTPPSRCGPWFLHLHTTPAETMPHGPTGTDVSGKRPSSAVGGRNRRGRCP